MKYLIFSLLFLLAPILHAQWTVETVPNQKLVNNSYVSNPDGVLNAATVASINSRLTDLERKTTIQIAVVAVNSIGDVDIFSFAQDLFMHWGIGQKKTDNGLLILLVKDARTIRFHTGDGLEGILPDMRCKRIQQDDMLPSFKSGDYDGGMLRGVEEVVRILGQPSSEYSYAADSELYAYKAKAFARSQENHRILESLLLFFALPVVIILFCRKLAKRTFLDSKKAAHTDYPEMRMSMPAWLCAFMLVPVLIVTAMRFIEMPYPFAVLAGGLYLYFLITLLFRLWHTKRVFRRLEAEGNYHSAVVFVRNHQLFWLCMALIYPLPFLPYFFYYLTRKRHYRNHPRTCRSCQAAMTKLGEEADDAHLSRAQQLEEDIRSVDYDVWKCTACPTTEIWNFPSSFTRYRECSFCSARTSYLASNIIITPATYHSTGKGEKTYDCKYCGKQERTTYIIAKLTRSRSGFLSGGGGSSSGGGGSWGGGSSSGGGASSSW